MPSRKPNAPGPQVPADALEFPSLTDLTVAEIATVRRIYEEAFPPRQREPFDDILAADADSRSEAVMLGGEVVGIAFSRRLRSAPWWFVEYVAISPERRDGGIGGRVWEHLRSEAEAGDARGLVLEVEDPGEAGIDSEEVGTRVRRIRFWERCGAVTLPVDQFTVPNLDGTGVERLLLMAYPEEAVGRPGDLAALVRAVYTDGYGLAEDHPLVVGALRALDGGSP